MITIEEALKKAVGYFTVVTGIDEGIHIEEAELDKKRGDWIITIGYEIKKQDTAPSSIDLALGYLRDYKKVTLNANTGEMVSVKTLV